MLIAHHKPRSPRTEEQEWAGHERRPGGNLEVLALKHRGLQLSHGRVGFRKPFSPDLATTALPFLVFAHRPFMTFFLIPSSPTPHCHFSQKLMSFLQVSPPHPRIFRLRRSNPDITGALVSLLPPTDPPSSSPRSFAAAVVEDGGQGDVDGAPPPCAGQVGRAAMDESNKHSEAECKI